MNDDLQDLIDGYLDDRLSPEESRRLNSLLKEDPNYSRQFARALLMHDQLRSALQADSLQADSLSADSLSGGPFSGGDQVASPVAPRTSMPRMRRTMTALAAVAAAAFFALVVWRDGPVTQASAAIVALDRMIEAASQPIDRVYRIHVTDPGPAGAEPPVFTGGNGRKPGIDGAELYVRGSDKFVLVRHFGDGSEFVTGSNGVQGWAVAPKGAIHVSNDPRRFRRAVPGEHEEIPFLDLKTGLGELRRAYELSLTSAEQAAPDEHGGSRLDAVKRSHYRGGPEQVRIWCDPLDGVVHRIELTGLARAEDGVHSVSLELLDRPDLGANFFEHRSHHAADRRVDFE